MLGGERGSATVPALLLLGLFMLLLAMVAELGALRAKTMRLQSAFDRAALAGAGAIDSRALADRGQILLDPAAAEQIARRYLVLNLEPVETLLAGQTAAQVAAGARVRARAEPRPEVTLTGRVTLPSGLLAIAGAGRTITYQIQSSSLLKGP